MTKVTLKMIAERCGVSTAAVSACLNGNNPRIACSPAKAEEIRNVAAEMHYTPSLFARSIRTKEIPIVGAFFHAEAETWQLHHRYFQTHLMEMTFLLNKEDLEVTFIPYHTEQEQLNRLQRMIARGMIGGVVSNILPHSHTTFCNYLKTCGLPYMVMGAPSVPEVYSVFYDLKEMESVQERLFRESGLKHCFRVFVNRGETAFYPGLPVSGFRKREKKLSMDEIKPLADEAYFIVPGHETLNYLHCQGFFPPHLLLCEQASEYMMPSPDYDLVVVDVQSNRIRCVAAAIARWMKSGEKPEIFSRSVSDYESIHVYPRLSVASAKEKTTSRKSNRKEENR